MDFLKDVSYESFVQWGFFLLAGYVLKNSTKFLKDLVYSVHELNETVSNLNEKMAVIVEKVSNHESEIEKHDKRIMRLEFKKRID